MNVLKNAELKYEALTEGIRSFMASALGSFAYSKTNLFELILGTVRDIAQGILLHYEAAASENNIYTAVNEASLRHFAELSGHRPLRGTASAGIAELTLINAPDAPKGIMLARHAPVKCIETQGMFFLDIAGDYITCAAGGTASLPLCEGRIEEQTFVASGGPLFSVSLDSLSEIAEGRIGVYVGGEAWEERPSLYDMGYGEKCFFVRAGFADSQCDIYFGNGRCGAIPKDGASIRCIYAVTAGSAGIPPENAAFAIAGGSFTLGGESYIPDTAIANIAAKSGFMLAGDGDGMDTLRAAVGRSSRAMILATPRNFEAYLSRYSAISSVRAYTAPEDERQIRITALPVVKADTWAAYAALADADFAMPPAHKKALQDAIKNGGRHAMISGLSFDDPIPKPYAAFVHIDAEPADKAGAKAAAEGALHKAAMLMLSPSGGRTFAKSLMIKMLHEAVGLPLSLHIVSKDEEDAKIAGAYSYYEETNENGILRLILRERAYMEGVRIGLSEGGDIIVRSIRELPVFRGGFDIKSDTGAVRIHNALTIYYKKNGNWAVL